jgi:hypothetical protein
MDEEGSKSVRDLVWGVLTQEDRKSTLIPSNNFGAVKPKSASLCGGFKEKLP